MRIHDQHEMEMVLLNEHDLEIDEVREDEDQTHEHEQIHEQIHEHELHRKRLLDLDKVDDEEVMEEEGVNGYKLK